MYNTDKSELLDEYKMLFSDLKDEYMNFLEIGIWEIRQGLKINHLK